MSLLSVAMTECAMIEKSISPDGFGGQNLSETEGQHFFAAIVQNSSTAFQTAFQAVSESSYTVTTSKIFVLRFHDTFKRLIDGKKFRVTSDGGEVKTPDVSSLDMLQVQAEEWKNA